MSRALITGATGFIGFHVANELTQQGVDIACLVRPTSNRAALESLRAEFVFGDLGDQQAVRRTLRNVDVVYHVAGATKALNPAEMLRVNEAGTRMIARCCAEQQNPPTLVVVSSLAAAGPSPQDRPRLESDPPAPVSYYGRSKRAGELAAAKFAAQIPITIVRPPVVLGEGDHDGFPIYSGLAKLGLHLVPGFSPDHRLSVVHAQDLARAMIQLAATGERLTDQNSANGIYFVADQQMPTYADLGRMIGKALGRENISVLRLPKLAIWSAAFVNEVIAKIRRRPHYLSLDKVREATAGSWTCSTASLQRDIGFTPARPLEERLVETIQWYIDQGWLKKPKH